MDAKIKSGRIKIKKLENKAIDEEITSQFKNVHALAIEYAQAMADAGSFLSCTLVSVGRFAILKNLRFVRFLLDTYVTLHSFYRCIKNPYLRVTIYFGKKIET